MSISTARVAGTKVPALIERCSGGLLWPDIWRVLPELKFRPSLSARRISSWAWGVGGVAGTKVPALIERSPQPARHE